MIKVISFSSSNPLKKGETIGFTIRKKPIIKQQKNVYKKSYTNVQSDKNIAKRENIKRLDIKIVLSKIAFFLSVSIFKYSDKNLPLNSSSCNLFLFLNVFKNTYIEIGIAVT